MASSLRDLYTSRRKPRPFGFVASTLIGLLLALPVSAFGQQAGTTPTPTDTQQTTQPTSPKQPEQAPPSAGTAAHTDTNTPPTALPGQLTEAERKANRDVQTWVIRMAMAILLAVTIALFVYIWSLRVQLAKLAAGNDEARALIFKMALGVPDGTIRSAIAVLIVLGALLSLIAAIGKDLGFSVPEALTGVFGTILGFYFGRAGTVETSQASAAAVTVAQSAARAADGVAAAQKLATEQAQALGTAQFADYNELVKKTDVLLAAVESVVADCPPGSKAPQDALASGRDAINAAKRSNSPTALKSALDQLIQNGPIAQMLRPALSALAPFAQVGLSPLQGARALASISLKLPPAVASRWIARVTNMPFRAELFSPTVDESYASALIAQVPAAAAFVTQIRNSSVAQTAQPPPTALDVIRLALQEDAATVISSRWPGVLTRDAMDEMVSRLQAHAIELQLADELPADLTRPFGGAPALFSALDQIQADQNGVRALDLLMLVARKARDAGIPPTDLLPST